MQNLKDHLLSKLLGLDYDGDEQTFTSDEQNNLYFTNLNSVVELKLLWVNYTTYDIYRGHDMIRTRCNDVVIMLSRDKQHPFWYARIIHAFHIQFFFCGDGVTWSRHSMEVLWVHWLGIAQQSKWGFKEARLPKVGFVPDMADHVPFGFLDPSLVIQGCHLIPAFSEGCTSELLQKGPSFSRLPGEEDDWAGFYINMWVHIHVSKCLD